MATHDVTATLGARADLRLDPVDAAIEYIHFGVGVMQDTVITNAAYEYINFSISAIQENVNAGEFIYGEINNYLQVSATLRATATTTSVLGYSATAAGTTSIAPTYPTGSSVDELIFFVAGMKQYYNTLSNANFTKAAWNAYAYTDTLTQQPQPVGDDIGIPRVEHQYRILTASASGTETFTNTGDLTNTSAIGEFIRLKKSASDDWVVRSYAQNSGGYVSTNIVEATSNSGRTMVKLSDQPIRSIGNDPDAGIAVAVGNGVWRSFNAHTWTSLTFPFGADYATRVEYGDGVWIMCGLNGKISRSLDGGSTWSTATTPLGSGHLYGLRYANGRWVITGNAGLIATSDDGGQSWTQRTSPVSTVLYSAAWGDGKNSLTELQKWYPNDGIWFICGANSRILRSEDNGTTWNVEIWEDNNTSGNFFDICYTAGGDSNLHFVASGDKNAGNWSSQLGYSIDYHTHALFSVDTDTAYWRHGSSGYYYGNLYNYSWNGGWAYIATARSIAADGYGFWNWATNDADMYWKRMNYDGYSAKYALLGNRNAIVNQPPSLAGQWANNAGYDYYDKGRGYWIYGQVNGYLFIDSETTKKSGTYPGEIVENYYKYPDIRPGDLIVFTFASTTTAETISNIRIGQGLSNVESTSPYDVWLGTTTDPLWSTSTPTIISSVKSTTGDNVYLITGYCYSNSELNFAYGYNTYYDPGYSYHYVTVEPSIQIRGDITGTPTGYESSNYRPLGLSVISGDRYGPYLRARASMTATAERRYHGVGPECPGATANAEMTVIAHVDPVVHYGNSFSYNYTETSGQTLTLSYSGSIPAGALIIAEAAMDNASGTTPTITATDNYSNSWTTNVQKIQNATAAAGVVTAIMSTTTAAEMSGTYTITVTASVAVKCRIISARWYTGAGPASAASTNSNSGASTTATVTLTTPTTGDLVVGAVGWESDVAATLEGDTTNGSWVNTVNGATGTGGNSATHIRLASHYKIVTATGSQTYDATTPSTDWASAIAAWRTPKAVSLYNFINASMTVGSTLMQAKNFTATLPASAAITVEATHIPASGSVVTIQSVAGMTANAVTIQAVGAYLEAEALTDIVAYIPIIYTASAPLSAVASLTGEVQVPKTYTASAALSATASITPGFTYSSTASLTAVATLDMANALMPNPGDSVFTENPNTPDENPTPENPPTYGTSGAYGFGDLLEITNRHYNKRYKTHRVSPSIVGKKSRYSAGAVDGQVIHLGNNRVLAVWIQENLGHIKNNTTPPILVATILDCANRDPIVITQKRHDLPLDARTWRSKFGGLLQDLENGNYFYLANGFGEDTSPFPDLDEGSYGDMFGGHPGFSFAASIKVDGDDVSFNWTKIWGCLYGTAGGQTEWMGLTKDICAVHNGDLIIVLMHTGGPVRLVRVNTSTGEWTDTGPTVFTGSFPDWHWVGQQIYSGADFYALGFEGYSGQTQYMKFNLNTLEWDGEYRHGLDYKGEPISPGIFRTGYGPKHSIEGDQAFSFAFVGGTASQSDKRVRVLKWFINPDGVPEVSEMWSNDIACIPSDIWAWVPGQPINHDYGDPADTSYGNFAVMEDDLRGSGEVDEYDQWNWLDRYLSADWSNYNWMCATHREDEFTYVYLTTELGTGDQYPTRSIGAHCVYKLQSTETTDDMGRASAWYTNPVDNLTWQSFFPIRDEAGVRGAYGDTYVDAHLEALSKTFGFVYVGQVVGCMLDNGNVLVLITGTNNGHEDQYTNGEYRAFACIVKIGDPPPLKMTYRDDDLTMGAARLGYIPQNGVSDRLGYQGY